MGKGALHTPKEQPSTGRFSVCGQLLQCETHELPSNAPQALVMAEQLRESPPETAGSLIPGKWEADLGQGCDTYKESHYRCTYRHRSRKAHLERHTKVDTPPGEDRERKELSTMSSACTSGPHPVTPKILHFLRPPYG